MGRIPKCRHCKEYILDKENDGIKDKNYWFHKECYSKYLKEKEKEKDDRQKLFDYIQYEIYDGDAPVSEFILANKYHKQFEYTWIGMKLTLELIVEKINSSEIEDYCAEKTNLMGLVPYYYTQAKKKYKKEIEIRKAVESFEYKNEMSIANRKITDNSYNKRMKQRYTMEEILNG